MSEKELSLAPIVEGVEKIADFAAKTAKDVEEKTKNLEAKQEKAAKDLDEKMERGFANVMERFETLSKRYSAVGALRLEQDDMEALKDAIPEQRRGIISLCEQASQDYKKDSRLHDPRFAAASLEWMKLSSKLQLRQFGPSHQDLMERFKKLDERFGAISKANSYNQNETTGTEGGYLVPTIVGNEVLRLIRDAGDIYPRCRHIPMTSLTMDLPREDTAITIYWPAEAAGATKDIPVYGKATLSASKLMGRATITMEALDDSNVALLPYLQSCFAEKMAGELDFVTMEGTTPFTGVLTASSVNALTDATYTTVGQYISYAQIVATFTKAGEANTRANGIWVCNPSIYGAIIGLVDSNGQPVVKLGTVETAPNGTLLGRPIIVSNRLLSTSPGTGSAANLYFGPPSALIWGDRMAMRWDVTDQVNWGTTMIDCRLVGRFAYIVGVPTAWTRRTLIRY